MSKINKNGNKSGILDSVDSKIDPYLGSLMYRIFKAIAITYMYIATIIIVLLVGALALGDTFVGTNQWIWIGSIFVPYIVVMGILCGLWLYFSKWADVVKEDGGQNNG